MNRFSAFVQLLVGLTLAALVQDIDKASAGLTSLFSSPDRVMQELLPWVLCMQLFRHVHGWLAWDSVRHANKSVSWCLEEEDWFRVFQFIAQTSAALLAPLGLMHLLTSGIGHRSVLLNLGAPATFLFYPAAVFVAFNMALYFGRSRCGEDSEREAHKLLTSAARNWAVIDAVVWIPVFLALVAVRVFVVAGCDVPCKASPAVETVVLLYCFGTVLSIAVDYLMNRRLYFSSAALS